MKRDTGRSTEKPAGNPKVGAGVKPTGVFKRIADADRKSGVADRVRHTQPDNCKS
jgi:hypothetical protein